LTQAHHELLTEVHLQLRHAGIALAVAGTPTKPAPPPPSPKDLLAQSDLFGVIEQTQREELASHFETIWLQPGETLFREGGTPQALYVLAYGAVEITISGRVVAHMRPGESLGAIGLITGANYGATATALTPVKAYRLDKAAIAQAIKAQPNLAKGLEALAERGRAALSKDAAAHEEDRLGEQDMFLSRLRNLVHLLQSH
jgi:CRP-like cAMP-binding protein